VVGWPDQRYAEWQSVILEPGRNRHCGIIEEIDEIRLVAEIVIEAYGVLLHRFDGINRTRGGQQQALRFPPYLIGVAFKLP
jgi:hypothetical protein